jgi:tetratricopeptide (TPR) repeat protein
MVLVVESRQPPDTGTTSTTLGELTTIMDAHDHDDNDNVISAPAVPSEQQLVLMSLDYLRDLRRTYSANPQDLSESEGLDADWLTLAVYALSRSFAPGTPLAEANDPWKERTTSTTTNATMTSCHISSLPPLSEMTKEVVYTANPNAKSSTSSSPPSKTSSTSKKEEQEDALAQPPKDDGDDCLEAFSWYDYDDGHASNAQRLYMLNGLANRTPLLLGEVAAAGLASLQARSRQAAEDDMIASPLFEQFVQAVTSKGFFKDSTNDNAYEPSTTRTNSNTNENQVEEQERLKKQSLVYQERYQKVVAKFRTKLALKADPGEASFGTGSGNSTQLSDQQYTRRVRRCLQVRKEKRLVLNSYNENHSVQQTYTQAQRLAPGTTQTNPAAAAADAEKDTWLQDAERLKNSGNAHMQQKDYPAAAASYTQALKLSPAGPNSHVYFSNRAAALLSMKHFAEAIADSERSLSLKPNYGKAHARLGLAHFLLGDYRPAMEAYTVALKYEPDNKSSKSYLEKAAKRLAKTQASKPHQQQHQQQHQHQQNHLEPEEESTAPTSFSVVSEWDKSTKRRTTPAMPAMPTSTTTSTATPEHREAEQLKILGNQCMAHRDYLQALDAYSQAIALVPNGPQSHVYLSNRAAALCYLERYQEAAQDSKASLVLKPNYGKAHARLGLSRYFLQDYPGAVQAYTAALRYDPDNAASKSYLAKARLKLEQQQLQQMAALNNTGNGSHDRGRRLLDDPDMHIMAKKAMSLTNAHSSSSSLMEDPEMQHMAKKAIQDPSMMAAVKAMVNH